MLKKPFRDLFVKTLAPAFTAAWLVLAPATGARAGEARCWIDQGVVVVPAVVAGVAGDYILDTAAPHTLLHETRAQGAGIAETEILTEIRLAGRRFADRPVAVADLDARTAAFPTPIAGVLGADILSGQVLDVRFAPCRIGLYDRRTAPRFAGGRALRLRVADGMLAAPALATDGKRVLAGDFVLATGSGAPLTLDEAFVEARAGAAPPAERRLRALSFAGDLQENPWTRVTAGGPAAMLGAPALARYRLRFDLARGRLRLAPAQQEGPPDDAGGP